MHFTRSVVILFLFGLGAALSFAPSMGNNQAAASLRLVTQQKKDECEEKKPWQHKVNGECVDKPGTIHHNDRNYQRQPSEECWIECLCYDGQNMSGDGCGSCSFVSIVCVPR